MSSASDAMGDRLRPLLPAGLIEKKMFGGLGFMLHGNMAIGTTAKGELLVRIDPAKQAEALARPGAYQMHMGPRPMTGFIAIDASGTPDDAALNRWIAHALAFTETLPPEMKSASTTMTHLAERIRDILDGDPRITEKTMFGGLTFLLNGHILVGCKKDGRILLSVGKDNNDAALARPGATQMIHGDKAMRGFIWVDAEAIEEDDDLRDWVTTAERWVAAMPPK